MIDIHMPLHSRGNCAFIQMRASNPLKVREGMQTAMSNQMSPGLTVVVDEDVDIYDNNDVLFALSIRADALNSAEGFNGTRGMPEPLTTAIFRPDDIRPLPNNRWAIEATKPSLVEHNRREEFVRLRARGEGRVKLAPQTLEDIVDHSAGRMLGIYDIDSNRVSRWNGIGESRRPSPEEGLLAAGGC